MPSASVRSALRRFVALLLVCTAVGSARAQKISASVSPAVIGRGQAAEFTIAYDGPQVSIESVPQIGVPGLEISGPQQRASFTSVNGQVRYSVELAWQVYAAQPGTYTIPALQIILSGQPYTTTEAKLEVRDGPAPAVSFEPSLRIAVGKTDLYVGELTSINLTAFFHRRTQIRNYDHPKLPRENFVVKRFPPPGPAAPVEMNGERYQPITFASTISALKEGQLELGPATLECIVDFPSGDDPNANRNVPPGFPPSFFQRMITRQLNLQSDKVALHVKALPAQGRPADFAGAVGRFSVISRVTQPVQQLKPGDPISVDLFVSGRGNFDTVAAPLLELSEGWKVYPAKVTQENRATGLEPGTVTYNQVLVPTKVTSVIPGFVLSFFDPDEEKYVTFRSEPIPIQMIDEPAKADPRSGEAPTHDFSLLDAGIPEEQLTDIVTARPQRGPLQSLTPVVAGEAVWWGAQAVPAAVVLALAGVGLQRRARVRAEEEKRRLAGLPRTPVAVWRELKRTGQPRRDFYTLAREYVDSWQHYQRQPAAAAGLNGELDLILSRQGYYAYAGSGAEGETPVPAPEQNEILTALERLPR